MVMARENCGFVDPGSLGGFGMEILARRFFD
jgi:hypothetical protein